MSQVKIEGTRSGILGLETEYSHDSFAIAQFCRFSSHDKNYFGSEPITGDGIALTIRKANISINSQGDKRVYATSSPFIEVKMTYNQFAELIGTMNVGEGVPVTLTHKDGQKVEFGDIKEVRSEDIVDEAENVVKTIRNRVNDSISSAEQIINNSKLPKKDKEAILNSLYTVKCNSNSNLDFYQDKFKNRIVDELTRAKVELDSVIAGRYSMIGEEYLKHKGLLNQKEEK